MEKGPSWKANRFSSSQDFPLIYGKRRIITAVTSVRHLSLTWAKSIEFTHPHPTSGGSILILSSIYAWSCKWFLSFRFPHQNPVYASPLPQTPHMSCLSHSSRFITWPILGEGYTPLSSLLCSFSLTLSHRPSWAQIFIFTTSVS